MMQKCGTAKIGLFGGTFDPIHHGHLIMAREAREELGLDEVVFVPARISPHKLGTHPASPEARCAMVEAAIRGEEGFAWSDCEALRGGPSFAIDTVNSLAAQRPGVELFFFIGSDNVPTLHTWRKIDELRRLVRFVVLCRGDQTAPEDFLTVQREVDISSTDIRNRIASGLSVRYLLPEVVHEFIQNHGLYRNE